MQIVKITASFIFSNDCTGGILFEIAERYCGMTIDAVNKLAKQTLSKASNGSGGRSNGVGNLEFPKLRTVVVQKLQDGQDYGDAFKTNDLELEINCLPDLDIGKAGANKTGGTRKASSKLTGAYRVAKVGVKCTADNDPDKYEIWQHVWNCGSFEEYFQKAPKKGVTKTGRVITAASEMRWAVKCGWIVPTATTAK